MGAHKNNKSQDKKPPPDTLSRRHTHFIKEKILIPLLLVSSRSVLRRNGTRTYCSVLFLFHFNKRGDSKIEKLCQERIGGKDELELTRSQNIRGEQHPYESAEEKRTYVNIQNQGEEYTTYHQIPQVEPGRHIFFRCAPRQ